MPIDREYTREEMQALIDKAQRELQETLDKMTPEERRQAEIKAQQAIAEDEARINKLLADAAKLTAKSESKPAPKFCSNCGAPAGGGNFCAYCGNQLR